MTIDYRSASAKKNRNIALPPARWRLLLAILAVSLGSSALAQTAPPATYTPSQPYFYPAPPAGFNPLAASDADLKTYGFPPQPAVTSAGYANWAKTVTGGKSRLTNLTAVQSTIAHRPAMATGPAEGAMGGVNGSNCVEGQNCSQNWAGYAETSSSGYFTANNSHVYIEFIVPPVAVENCSYAPYQAAVWAGLDGWNGTLGAGDILQAGVLATACPGQGTFQSGATYQAVYQWYTDDNPCCYSFLTISSGPQAGQQFTMNAGDIAEVTVWYSTTGFPGNLYIVDWTTGNTASLGFNEPTPTAYPYQGTSAEWVLERPIQYSALTNLAAYGSSTMPDNGSLSVIGDYNGFAPGAGPLGGPIALGMYCDAAKYDWLPYSACPGSPSVITSVAYNQVGGPMVFTPGPPASVQ